MRLGTNVLSNSRIQFASNQSKLVPRKFDPGPLAKVALSISKDNERLKKYLWAP